MNTLSKYSPSVFVQAGRGKWGLALSEEKFKKPCREHSFTGDIYVCELVWEAVNKIEQKDYVYKLLTKAGRPLTYSQIVDYLAKDMKIDPKQLAMTDFLNPKDDRFKQLDDGTWALSEWIDKNEPKEEDKIEIERGIESPPEINRVFFFIKQYCWVILVATICIIGAILIWLFN